MSGLAFAYAGCASRAAFLVGASRALIDQGIRPDIVTGASSGAMVAAAVSVDALVDLESQWDALLGQTRVWQPEVMWRGRWPLRMSHILRPALEARLGDRRMGEADLLLGITVTRLGLRGRREVLIGPEDGVAIVDAVMASCFIPGIYSRPQWHARRPAVDGAWLRRVPVDGAVELGACKVVAFVSEPHGRLEGGLLRRRVLETPAHTRVLAPLAPIPVQGFDFDAGRTRAAVALGRSSAEAFLERHGSWLTSR